MSDSATFPHLKTLAFDHQSQWFDRTHDRRAHGALWEQGTGKSWFTIATAFDLYDAGEIDGALIIAPPSVHRVWLNDMLQEHLTEDAMQLVHPMAWRSGQSASASMRMAEGRLLSSNAFPWLTINYEATITRMGQRLVERFLHRRRALMVLDEAHHIKTPGAKRTKRIIPWGKRAPYRRILTGTPVANSPFDIYAPMRFLDEAFWRREGMSTFAAFKARYGILETRAYGDRPAFTQVVGYQRLEELSDRIAIGTSRVTKEDALDLPPKLYQKRYVQLSAEQRRVYDELRDDMITRLDSGERVTAPMAIVNLLRLQQVTRGYVPDDEEKELRPIGDSNPTIDELVNVLDETVGSAIIWARFRADVDRICAALHERYGQRSYVRYDGAVPMSQRDEAKDRFQAREARFFVGNPAAAAEGVTLHAATTVIYYSNSFNLVHRLQSEDRAHRIGQEHAVTYIDLVAEDTVDERIVDALRRKWNVASQLTGDELREWL